MCNHEFDIRSITTKEGIFLVKSCKKCSEIQKTYIGRQDDYIIGTNMIDDG